jgi:hypothetical protein
MRTLSLDVARELIDFDPEVNGRRMGFGESQLEGAVTLHNMLATNHCAYLADEVGMGKTYVALGVMGLMRHFQPGARVVILTPRENIQHKWAKELRNFVRNNWRCVDNRVKSIQGTPARPIVTSQRLAEFSADIVRNSHRDFILRMTSFSLALKEPAARKAYRQQLLGTIPWMPRGMVPVRSWEDFRDAYGRALNAVIPPIDLLIVDEGHNLKHGFRGRVSIRNRMLGMALGHPEGVADGADWFAPKVRNVLLLSATPFEQDYAGLQRQLDVLGFGDARLASPTGDDSISVAGLLDDDRTDEHREIVRRLLVRRVSGLRFGGRLHTKNMYRREWRAGGYSLHDRPMAVTDTRERLVLALVQKKVSEILGDERFQNQFQIGMLSSFESFCESLGRMKRGRRRSGGAEEGDADGESTFHARDQEASDTERRGIDTSALDEIVRSYVDRFGEPLPHPKLDHTVGAFSDVFDTGEKALIFVRRIATVRELVSRMGRVFDDWVERRLRSTLPELSPDLDELFTEYRKARGEPDDATMAGDDRESRDGTAPDAEMEQAPARAPEDEGGNDSFFSWFFRGQGPDGWYSGAHVQRIRLAGDSAAYRTLFEDDHVSWILGRPPDVLAALARATGLDGVTLRERLRRDAWSHFRQRTDQREGYPRLYVFEAYQVAALDLLCQCKSSELSTQAQIVRAERFREAARDAGAPRKQFPSPEDALGIPTFFTCLVENDELRQRIWPSEATESDFRERFRRREQRRELISAMARLGATYIDLYGLALREIGTLRRPPGRMPEMTARSLHQDFVDLLQSQSREPGFHAYRELSEAADAFDTILAVNFPEAPQARLNELATIYGRVLQRQVPVVGMSAGVAKRFVQQFRMPGFPLLLVTTDVLQEGEDLHTFCRRPVHYGIAWTPSACEQRVGRVDRIGSLVQRRLDGLDQAPDLEDLIQVYYPHLEDTVEVLQVKRVLHRLNRFLTLIHKVDTPSDGRASRISTDREFLSSPLDVAPITEPLESAFPIDKGFLDGVRTSDDESLPDVGALEAHLQRLWDRLCQSRGILERAAAHGRERVGIARLRGRRVVSCDHSAPAEGDREQPFELQLRSRQRGHRTLLRCISPVGPVPQLLNHDDRLDQLYDLQQDLGMARVCVRQRPNRRMDAISVENDVLFDPATTQYEEFEGLVIDTLRSADAIEEALMGSDASPDEWLSRDGGGDG